MQHRLDKLCFPPPPADGSWSASPAESTRCKIKRADAKVVAIDVPLFWFDPPWHQLSTDAADLVAAAVADLGVIVSAMRSDLSGPDGESSFLGLPSAESDAEDAGQQNDSESLPRMVPYRPERYGLSDCDFDGARIIDVRLAMNRDETGRFAFSPEQIERWEATPESHPLAGGGWVPSISFPPDVASIDQLSSKLDQLRVLSPSAAVFVSIGAHRLEEELPQVIAANPEGLILRLEDLALEGLQLAAVTQHARQLADRCGVPHMPLWVVPGAITPDDAVKLVALGASAVAIDSWCAEVMDEVAEKDRQSSSYSSRGVNEEFLSQLVEEELAAKVERFKGLFSSSRHLPPSDRLACLSEAWGKALGVKLLSLPLPSDE